MTCNDCIHSIACLEPGVPARCAIGNEPDGCTEHHRRLTDTERLDLLGRIAHEATSAVSIDDSYVHCSNAREYVVGENDHILGYGDHIGRGTTIREAIDNLARTEAGR
jgi:hypothetical protein